MKYESLAGDRIEGTFQAMVTLANRHQQTVESEFNGQTIIAQPGDNAKDLLRAWQTKQDAEQKAYDESPDGIKAKAEADERNQKAESKVKSVLANTKFEWTSEMREISGFGGGYETACRAMVSAGVQWLADNPKADPKFHGYKNITGILMEDNEDAKALSAAVSDGSGGDCTGAMHQFAVIHAMHAHKIGWPAYVKMMREAKEKESAKAKL